MINNAHTVKINLPGGIVSAGNLYLILQAAEAAAVSHIRFGNRQQLFFSVAAQALEDLSRTMLAANIMFEQDTDLHPNILSSYVTEDVFYHASWLREGVYKDILDGFDYRPQLKINLVDNAQSFVPFFTGNLNFIASDLSNYWHLHIRFPKTNIIYIWPSLVYSEDIAGLSSLLEHIIFSEKDRFYDQAHIRGGELYARVSARAHFVVQPLDSPLRLPEFTLPYYEGFNRYENKLWLGIYRRDECFPLSFLKDLCRVALKTRIGQFHTTPWKSLVIKGIGLSERSLWDAVLCLYRINVRHASNELNWQVEDHCQQGLRLKQYLVHRFNEADLRTYRLCFAIKTQPKTGLFGSIIIRTRHPLSEEVAFEQETFEVLYTRDFNPNSKEFIQFRDNIKIDALDTVLMELCNFYYEKKLEPGFMTDLSVQDTKEEIVSPPRQIYACSRCLSRYDEAFGDALQGIVPGTPFVALQDYCCPTCESPRESFRPITVRLGRPAEKV